MAALDDWLNRARSLRLDRSGGARKPYKPAMLLAAILLVRKGYFADNLLTLGELGPVFDQVLRVIAPTSPGPSDRKLPFRHLVSDGIWKLVPGAGRQQRQGDLVVVGARAREVLRHTVGVTLPASVFACLRDSQADAVRAATTVFDCYVSVFAEWGLSTPRLARDVLTAWLGSPGGSAIDYGDRVSRTLDERMVEQWIEQHWSETPFCQRGLVLEGRQVMTPVNAIDLLAHEPVRSIWWVMEIKRGNSSDAVVGQLARYRGWIAREKGVLLDSACGIVLTDSVSEKLRLAMQTQRGTQLWRYDDAFAFEMLMP